MLSGFGVPFRTLGFDFLFTGVEFRVVGFRSGLRDLELCLRSRVSGFGVPVRASRFGLLFTGVRFQVSGRGLRFSVAGFGFRVQGLGFRVSGTGDVEPAGRAGLEFRGVFGLRR